MPGRFLSLFKSIGRVLPEIKKPERKVSFNEKIFWTALVLVVFLVMTEIPLFGIEQQASDQFGQLRAVSYTHLRAHETRHDIVCRLLLEKKKNTNLARSSPTEPTSTMTTPSQC